MYESYFELKEKPYSLSPDPRFIYLSSQHQEAFAKCQYAIAQKMGLSVIYGDIGTGKTSLSRRLLQRCADNKKYKVAVLVHPNYPSAFQFIKEIRREFGSIQPRRSLTDELNDFRKILAEDFKQGRTTVLLIDEAQKLRPPLFEIIRQLLNYETNTEKLLQLVLFGQNELALKIDKLPELKDRVTIFGALSSLTKHDTDELIRFRWRVAGGMEPPFSKEALERIFRYSGGRPRKVCKICDNALIRAYSSDMREIDGVLIDQVAEDIRLSPTEPIKEKAQQTTTADAAKVASV